MSDALDNARAALVAEACDKYPIPAPVDYATDASFAMQVVFVQGRRQGWIDAHVEQPAASERLTAPPADDVREALLSAVDEIQNPFGRATAAQERLVLNAAEKWATHVCPVTDAEDRPRGPVTDAEVQAALAAFRARPFDPWLDRMRAALEALDGSQQ